MIEKILRFFTALFLGLAVLAPLIIYTKVPFPFIFSKVIWFRVFCELAFLSWLILALRNWRNYGIRFSWILVCLVGLGLCLFVSSLGDSFSRSFFGSLERGESLLSYIHYLCFFVVLSSFLRHFGEFKSLFYFVSFVASFVSLTVIFDEFNVFFSPSGGNFAFGFLGNSNFVPGVALFGLFSCLFLIFTRSRFAVLGVLINFVALIFCSSRAGWFGFACGFLFLFFTLIFSKGFNSKLRFSLLVLFSCVPLFFLMILQSSSFRGDVFADWRDSFLFQRYLSAFEGDKARFYNWEMALESIQDNKWLGGGFESYEIVYSKYFKKRYEPILSPAVPYDLPHNKLLEVMVEGGGLAGVFYLLLFFFALFALKKYQSDSFFFPVLGGWLIAYFCQNLFVFDTVSSQIFFFFGLAMIVSLKFSQPKKIDLNFQKYADIPY